MFWLNLWAQKHKGGLVMMNRRNTQRHDRRCMRSRIVMVALVFLAGVLAFAMTGCKDTLKLTEIIYDQEAETVDYDNPTKVLVQDPDAQETSDQLPLIEKDEDDPEEETPEEPDFGEDESDMEVAGVVFGSSPSTTQQYASTEGGTNVAGGGSGETTEEEEGEGEEISEGGAGQESGGENAATSGGGGDVETPGEPGGDTGSDGDPGGTSGGSSNGDSRRISEFNPEDVPTGIDYVAAVGETATIVSMLAGDQGALLYTDAEWASRDNLATVLGNKFNNEVVAAWGKEGNSYYLSDEMFQTMVNDERLDAVIVASGDNILTEDQINQLTEAGKDVLEGYYDLRTASDIRDAVYYLGSIFASGDNANVGAEQLANEYIDFHDRILSNAAAYANTSLAESNMQSGLPVLSSSENMYTVYVSDWADNVEYNKDRDKVEGGLDTSNGIGIVELGYKWSPLSYYLSVGGAINTASQSVGSGTSLLWQFSPNHITALESDFSPPHLVSSYLGTSGYEGVYFTSAYLLDTAGTSLIDGGMRGAGTSYFPYVITNNQATKAKLEADRDSSANSLYKIYSPIQWGSGSVYIGPAVSAGNSPPLLSTAGVTSRQATIGNNTSLYDPQGYDVVTNPHGMFESWTDGTIESVLETAWISSLYRNGNDPSDDIYYFYRTFYGHSLSSDEYQMIIDGEVG